MASRVVLSPKAGLLCKKRELYVSLNAFQVLGDLQAYGLALRDLGVYGLVLRGLGAYGLALRGLGAYGLVPRGQ